jgi:hypothetical protein
MFAAATLVGFYAWWGNRLAARGVALVAVMITAIGMICDFSGEGLLALLLVERALTIGEDPAAFAGVERTFTLLSAATANGLYTIGGALLTLATAGLPPWIRLAMWGTWLAGAGMTAAAVVDSVSGMVFSAVVLFPLLLTWMAWMGARWRPA